MNPYRDSYSNGKYEVEHTKDILSIYKNGKFFVAIENSTASCDLLRDILSKLERQEIALNECLKYNGDTTKVESIIKSL